ncbi:uncharacterized protein LOC115073442 [Rhinatrema bivittatum]|uniref:uncharacterized protein LOC115073442 n=1 Tax=Rhinatrema bivittatum TaxID=194408 RepID=UPI00112D50E2|nr:uncharacterized protein LOC115073442 [Rhinatrema bivittatum]XP_029427731.1 uncharacterized protein LOC115073442 [Rhinatrema bivittatum]
MLEVLNKGLSFVPACRYDSFFTRTELHKFFRRLHIKEFFMNEDKPLERGGLYKPSKWTPSSAPSHLLQTFQSLVLRDVDLLDSQRDFVQYNLTREQWQAMIQLRDDSSIKISAADKGGAIVVMNQKDYDTEVHRQLNNQQAYRKLQYNPTSTLHSHVTELLEIARKDKVITNKEHQFLSVAFPTTAHLYILPKVHKTLNNPPGRPIVAGIGTVLEPLAQMIDHYLQPQVTAVPSYVKDSTDFINQLTEVPDIQPDWILLTADITSLYTCIPQREAFAIIKLELAKIDMSSRRLNFLCMIAEIALTQNVFSFQSEYFLQIEGIPMGSPMAPSVAGLYVAQFENQYVYHSVWYPYVKIWKRYIDDLFFVWSGGSSELDRFMLFLNSCDPHLEFTFTKHNQSIVFLDMRVQIYDGKLTTCVHRKSTDRNTLLHYQSFHPKQLKDNIPVGQFLRYRRLCTSTAEFKIQATQLKERFLARGYSKSVIKKAYKRALYANRDNLLIYSPKESPTRPICTIPFSSRVNQIKEAVCTHWHVLSSLPCFRDKPIFAIKKRHSLHDKLKGHPVVDALNSPHGQVPCGSCSVCSLTLQCQSFDHPHLKYPYRIPQVYDCNTSGVIYAIVCPCNLIYIGQTVRPIRYRIIEHRSRIKSVREHAPLVNHWVEKKSCGGGYTVFRD